MEYLGVGQVVVSKNPMRVQQAILETLAGSGNYASVERLKRMLRRFPEESIDEALRHLVDGGVIEIGEYKGHVRARLTEHFRAPRSPRAPPARAEEDEVPETPMPSLPFADSDDVLRTLRVVVEEARRFVRGEVYLGPFMKRRMNAEFPKMTNEERKALIDHLQAQGCLRIEKRPGESGQYSVMVLEHSHATVRRIWRSLAGARGVSAAEPVAPSDATLNTSGM